MFYIQQGWGMLSMIGEFLETHHNSGVILSPRVCERAQLENYVSTWRERDFELIFDPQFFEPRTGLERILSYPFWGDSFETSTFDSAEFGRAVINYQSESLELETIILPGRFTNSLTDSWLEMQHSFAQLKHEYENLTMYSTIALGPDVILNDNDFNTIIDETINYPTDGVYLLFEHPNNSFLIEDEEFIYVLLDACLSLSLASKSIINGYSNQQSIVFASAGVENIASGNYRNVRCFDHLNFSERDTEGWQRRAWYFDGNTFGEYTTQQLSLAYRRELSEYFGPPSDYTNNLLSSERPGDVRLQERDAFFHYFEIMKSICNDIVHVQRNERAHYILNLLNTIDENNRELITRGFNPGERGFPRACRASLDALNAFIMDRSTDINQL